MDEGDEEVKDVIMQDEEEILQQECFSRFSSYCED